MFKLISGIVMMIIAVVLGLYVGIWVCLVGGIAGLIDIISGAVNGNGISGMAVAINVVKIMFAGLVGWVSFAVLWFPGCFLITK